MRARRPTRAARQRRDRVAHGSSSSPRRRSAKSISPAAPWWPRWSSPREHEPGAEARADREEREVVDAARDAEPLLAERGEVDVVLERDGQPEPRARARRRARAPRARAMSDVRAHGPGVAVDDARDADDDAVDPLGRELGRGDQRVAQRRRSRRARRRRRRRAARRPGARAPPRARSQSAPRRNRAPRSRPSTSGGLRHGLEEDRAVARAARVAARPRARARRRRATGARARPSASRSRRGARSPRGEIGAPARIVSSTVRSFRCFRSGGVARCGDISSRILTKEGPESGLTPGRNMS